MLKGLIRILQVMIIFASAMALGSGISNIFLPWEGEETARTYSKGYLHIAVGGSSVGTEIKSRSYALIPISLSMPKMLFISKEESGKFSAEYNQFAFWLFGSLIVYGWYLTIRFVRYFIRTKNLPGGGAIKT